MDGYKKQCVHIYKRTGVFLSVRVQRQVVQKKEVLMVKMVSHIMTEFYTNVHVCICTSKSANQSV